MSIIITCKRKNRNNTRKEYPYQLKKGNGLYCSHNCSNLDNAKKRSKTRMGENNPMFGKTAWNYINCRGGKRFPTTKYWIWKRSVHNRDKNTCQNCFKIFPRKNLLPIILNLRKNMSNYGI